MSHAYKFSVYDLMLASDYNDVFTLVADIATKRDAKRIALARSRATGGYAVVPDVNDDAKCAYIGTDMIGTFAEYRDCDQAIECARIVSRCVASHVFVTDAECAPVAIYRRGVRVTREQYQEYADRVLFAHDTPATP